MKKAKKYLITAGIGLAFVALIIWSKDIFSQTAAVDVFHILCDAFCVVGVVLTTVVEAITRKKLDSKYEGYIHGAGMILLLGLMALIMFKDIFVLFRG